VDDDDVSMKEVEIVENNIHLDEFIDQFASELHLNTRSEEVTRPISSHLEDHLVNDVNDVMRFNSPQIESDGPHLSPNDFEFGARLHTHDPEDGISQSSPRSYLDTTTPSLESIAPPIISDTIHQTTFTSKLPTTEVTHTLESNERRLSLPQTESDQFDQSMSSHEALDRTPGRNRLSMELHCSPSAVGSLVEHNMMKQKITFHSEHLQLDDASKDNFIKFLSLSSNVTLASHQIISLNRLQKVLNLFVLKRDMDVNMQIERREGKLKVLMSRYVNSFRIFLILAMSQE
jgi:hypothetical protein